MKEIQIKIGRPSDNRYMKIVEGKYLLNCPITVEDVKRAIKINGPDRIAKKGTTVRAKGVVRPVFIPVDLPKLIYPKHKNACLCVDFFFVNSVTFFHSISIGINFRTVSHVRDRSLKTFISESTSVRKLYEGCGFRLVEI